MLREIDKDARAIAVLQQEVRELREQCVSNVHCIVALEEEIRILKAQQTKDYTHLMSMSTHQTESLGQQETGLAKLEQKWQDYAKRSTAFEKETRLCIDRIVSPATEPFVVDAVTGEKVRLLPLKGCPNIFILQAKGVHDYSPHLLMKNPFYSERPCWVISIKHWTSLLGSIENFLAEQAVEDRSIVKSFLFEHMENINVEKAKSYYVEYSVCAFKKLLPSYNVYRIAKDSQFLVCPPPLIDAFQPTLIEFVS
jgi:hypothetical protein